MKLGITWNTCVARLRGERPPRRPRPSRRRPRLEILEDRLAPSASVWTNFYPDDGTTYGTARVTSVVQDPTSPPGSLAGYVYAGGYTTDQSSTTTGFALAIASDGTRTTIFSKPNIKINDVSADASAVYLSGEDDSSGSPRAVLEVIPKAGSGPGRDGRGRGGFSGPVEYHPFDENLECFFLASGQANGALYVGGCCEVGDHLQAIVCKITFRPIMPIDAVAGIIVTCETVGPSGDCNSCVTHLHVDSSHVDYSGAYLCDDGSQGGFGGCLAGTLPPPHGPGPQSPYIQVTGVTFNALDVRVDDSGRHLYLVGNTDSGALFVGKYLVADGRVTEEWHHTYTAAAGPITGNGVTLDYAGNIYVVGGVAVDRGGATPVQDGYVMRLSSDGSTVEGLLYFGNQDDSQDASPTEALAIIPYYTDPADQTGSNPDFVVAGWTEYSGFDGNLATTGGQAGFVTRVCQDPNSCGALPQDNLITIS